MKIYKIFKKFMYVIDLFVVMICLYCWMINDFNSNLHDLGSKAIIVCVCVNLCCFIFEKKILSKSNKNLKWVNKIDLQRQYYWMFRPMPDTGIGFILPDQIHL